MATGFPGAPEPYCIRIQDNDVPLNVAAGAKASGMWVLSLFLALGALGRVLGVGSYGGVLEWYVDHPLELESRVVYIQVPREGEEVMEERGINQTLVPDVSAKGTPLKCLKCLKRLLDHFRGRSDVPCANILTHLPSYDG